MKKLILIRHGKSDWALSADDYLRPLSERGFIDAESVAAHTAKSVSPNAKIWSSPARRAETTCKVFSRIWNYDDHKVEYRDDLYTFDSTLLEKAIRTCSDSIEELIIFGHNEAITDFANKFGNILIDNVPTSGFVTLTFEADNWNRIKPGETGIVVFPKDIRNDH